MATAAEEAARCAAEVRRRHSDPEALRAAALLEEVARRLSVFMRPAADPLAVLFGILERLEDGRMGLAEAKGRADALLRAVALPAAERAALENFRAAEAARRDALAALAAGLAAAREGARGGAGRAPAEAEAQRLAEAALRQARIELSKAMGFTDPPIGKP